MTQETTPFDSVAELYDRDFQENPVTQHLRSTIWGSLLKHFSPGEHVLELNCGTGIDAVFLAEHDITVTAADISGEMLSRATQKIAAKGLNRFVTLRRLSFNELDTLIDETAQRRFLYDGVFSNFGGLNCAPDLGAVIENISRLVRSGGSFILCMLNRICAWEVVSFMVDGKPRDALRRLHKNGIDAAIGQGKVHSWYYSPQQFAGMASPWFTIEKVYGLSIFSPLLNSKNFVVRHPDLTKSLFVIDNFVRGVYPFYCLGDHFVAECKRKA